MISRENIYRKAFDIKKSLLSQKIKRQEMMIDGIRAANPRLAEIEQEQKTIGAQLAVLSLSGDTEKINDLKKRSAELALEKRTITDAQKIEDIKYDCKDCSDTGFKDGRICHCIKKIAAQLVVTELSAEMPLDSCRFDNFDLKYYKDTGEENPRRRMTAILKLCKEYVIGFEPKKSPNLLFMGQAGLGKTHLTLAIVQGVIDKGFIPIYGPAENLFSQIEREKFAGENRGTYDSMIKSDLLVIDDLGAEMATAFTKAALYNLINTRLLSKRPTIINTNLSMREIEAKYTARISSRLIGEFEAHKFLGEDIRQQKALKR